MDIFLVTLRILLAAFLGAIIGVEREMKNRAAGFRTHIIVSVGACLIMLIGIDGFGKISDDLGRDAARIAGQVVSGIGFYEGAVIATIICLVTLVSLKGVSDFINDMTTKSYIMVFDTDNFDEESFLDFASKEGVEVRKLDIIDEEIDDKSMINSTLSFNRNYNIGKFFKKLKSDYHLNSVKLSKQKN